MPFLKRVKVSDIRGFVLVMTMGILGLLFYFSLFFLSSCFSGTYAKVCGDYEVSTMLVTYELGWLPRGLLGAVLSVFGAENAILAAGFFTNLLLIGFLVSIVVLYFYLLRLDKNSAFLSLLFLVWPGLVVLGSRVSQPRADIFMYWLFWVCVLVAAFHPRCLMLVTIVCGVVAILVHEGWVLLFLPFLLFLIWSLFGFKQAVLTGVILLVPFLLVEILPHAGVDEVVDYVMSRKQIAGWYDKGSDSSSFLSFTRFETEAMAYFQYGDGFPLFNLINSFEYVRSFGIISWMFVTGLQFLVVSVPQLLLCVVAVGKKYGKRLALCVLPFLVLMLGTQLDWIRFVPMYTFGFGATVFVLWLRGYVKVPFDFDCEANNG